MILAWGARVSPEFRRKVLSIAQSVGCDPSYLMACMAFETGRTFSPSVRNPNSSATGLIQFMAATARDLGTTTEALAAMTAEEQLDYVARYFAPYRGRLRSLSDLYMAILWPAAVGKPDDHVLWSDESRAYLVNRGLDLDKDGAVTKGEAAAKVAKLLADGLLPANATEERTKRIATEEDTMAAPLIPILASALSALVPEIPKLFGGKPAGEVAQRNSALVETVAKVATAALGAAGPGDALDKLAAMPPEQKAQAAEAVSQAIKTDPALSLALTAAGPSVDKARDYDVKVTQGDKSFLWSPVFWISVLMLPMVYWFVGSVIAGSDVCEGAWCVFGKAWTGESRSGIANLVIGLVLGGICGVYYGISVTQKNANNGRPE